MLRAGKFAGLLGSVAILAAALCLDSRSSHAACELRDGAARPVTIAYHQDQQASFSLDAYFPRTGACSPRPVMVFAHGGSWFTGNKKAYAREAAIIADQADFVVVSIDYPLQTDPQIATDYMADAICWVRKNVGGLGINPSQVVVSGASAGGQMAASVALRAATFHTPNCTGSVMPNADALVLYNPILDFSTWRGRLLHGDLRLVNPMGYAARPLPPTVILQGTADRMAPVTTARAFVQQAQNAGNRNIRLLEYAGQPHGFFNNVRNGNMQKTTADVIAFLQSLNWH